MTTSHERDRRSANRIEMRIYSASLSPNEIALAIGLQSTEAVTKGDRRSDRSPPFRTNAWLWSSEGDDVDDTLDAHLVKLSKFVRDFTQLENNLARARLDVSFVVYHWPEHLEAIQIGRTARSIIACLPGEFWMHVAEYPD